METEPEPASVAVSFNDRINARDVEGLAALMTDGHTFVDSEGARVAGRPACLDAWRGFFQQFPDYRNVFASVEAQGDVVTIIGHSECTVPELAGPALWTARVRDGKVAEWRVHDDSPATRERLGLPV
jgi:ketosteroid isomerase-like protein